ncbi:MAG TPA: hypothetical protein EYP14_06975 [Planctomycetaceae bacterium]|nr:hypothetical protein [Planctomycetaceae bacterium]
MARVLRDRLPLQHSFGRVRSISGPYAQENAIFQLRSSMPNEVGCVYWRAMAELARSVSTPWY